MHWGDLAVCVCTDSYEIQSHGSHRPDLSGLKLFDTVDSEVGEGARSEHYSGHAQTKLGNKSDTGYDHFPVLVPADECGSMLDRGGLNLSWIPFLT
jgi:hypothetical protein